MGWKKVKEHYRIGHIVHVRDGRLLISSPYITGIIEVLPDGTLDKPDRKTTNEDLQRYQQEIEANPDRFRWLFAADDSFSADLDVYTFDDQTGEVTHEYCEAYGWPNVTHGGRLMHNNCYYPTADQAAAKAMTCAKQGFKSMARRIDEKMAEMKKIAEIEDNYFQSLLKLERDFPHLVEHPTPADHDEAIESLGCLYAYGDNCHRKECQKCNPPAPNNHGQ